MENKKPNFCRHCGKPLKETKGVVGEILMECPTHGVVWDEWKEAMTSKEE